MVIRRIRLVLLVITLVVLQTAVFPHLRVFGAIPDLCLVATVAIAYEEGPQTGALFGFVSGLVVDLFLASPLGLSALANSCTGYAVGVFQGGMVRESRMLPSVLGGIAGLGGGSMIVMVGGIVGQSGYLSLTSLRIVIVASIYDAVVAPAIFPFVRWANHDPDYGYRNRRR
ncbi:MAG: rod shape-determining protein MreD [Acidimicrobiia bacterium]